jgi:hypothetical protein
MNCSDTLPVFQHSCKEWGVPLADEKTVEPTEKLVFLGIEFDNRSTHRQKLVKIIVIFEFKSCQIKFSWGYP